MLFANDDSQFGQERRINCLTQGSDKHSSKWFSRCGSWSSRIRTAQEPGRNENLHIRCIGSESLKMGNSWWSSGKTSATGSSGDKYSAALIDLSSLAGLISSCQLDVLNYGGGKDSFKAIFLSWKEQPAAVSWLPIYFGDNSFLCNLVIFELGVHPKLTLNSHSSLPCLLSDTC